MSVRDREDAVVARLQTLAPQLDGEPDPAFREATRARLVAMAAVRTPAAPPVSPLRRLVTGGIPSPARWRARLTAGLAGAALTVTALATVVAVAADARPGDVLYGLKRGTEDTQLALAGNARGETLLEFASTRLEEVRSLVETGATALPAAGPSGSGEAVLAAGGDVALVVETLQTMDAQTAEGAAWLTERAVTTEDAGPLELLSEWTTAQSGELDTLGDDVPAAAADEVAGSLVLLADIATRVSGLASSLDCVGGPALGGSDELGPVPALCLPDGSVTAVPESPGGGSDSVPEAPPSGSPAGTPLPDPSLPSGGGTVPGAPGGTTDGRLPTPAVPPLPTPGLPSVPLPSASLPLPSAAPSTPRLPGTTGTSPLPGLPVPPMDVCLGPVTIGDC